jgi:hypothetical protein
VFLRSVTYSNPHETQQPHARAGTRCPGIHVPANLPRDDWARIGAAIKSEFPDSAGFDLFDTWSQSSEGYDPKATARDLEKPEGQRQNDHRHAVL